jgi:hypothetical protein
LHINQIHWRKENEGKRTKGGQKEKKFNFRGQKRRMKLAWRIKNCRGGKEGQNEFGEKVKNGIVPFLSIFLKDVNPGRRKVQRASISQFANPTEGDVRDNLEKGGARIKQLMMRKKCQNA